jgi:hypothetical protein
MIRQAALIVVCSAVFAHGGPILAAQAAKGPSGHWVGTLSGPGLTLEFDLAMKEGDVWHGTISIPAQGTKGAPLADVSVKGNAVSFAIKGAPGDPRFAGTLSEDGKNINGDFTQGGTSMPLSLARTGDAKFEVAQKSTPITKEVEGSWEGALEVQGSTLRLLLKLANAAGGATATLTSLDQGNVEIPVATVTQEGTRVKLIVSLISGMFDGELKAGELAGTWTQGPLSAPLVFKRTTR